MVLARRPPSSDFDLSLVLRARSGDPDAFTQLMDEYGTTVRRLVSRFVQDADDVRDVEQETWIRAASRLDTLHEPGRFQPWVKSIARHASLNFLAARKRRRDRVSTFEEHGTAEFEDREGETPERHVLSRDNQRRVWEALGGLSERDRTALYLREYRDLPYAEIALTLGISRSAAEVCVFRARERFRRLFADVEARTVACGVDPLRLSALVDGDGDPEQRRSLAMHVRDCDDCEDRLTTMQAGQALYRNLPAFGFPLAASTGALPALASSVAALGTKVLGALGIGGGSAAAAGSVGTAGAAAAGTGVIAGGASIMLAGAAAVAISAGGMSGGGAHLPLDVDPMSAPTVVATAVIAEHAIPATGAPVHAASLLTPEEREASLRRLRRDTNNDYDELTVAIVGDTAASVAAPVSSPAGGDDAGRDSTSDPTVDDSGTASDDAGRRVRDASAATDLGARNATTETTTADQAATDRVTALEQRQAAREEAKEQRQAAREEAKGERQAARVEAKDERQAAREDAKDERQAAREEARNDREAAREERQTAREERREERQAERAERRGR